MSDSVLALQYIKSLDECHTAAIAQAPDNPTVAKQVAQSFLYEPIPKQSMAMLRNNNFESAPADLQEATRGLFGLGQTVVCEQANRSARNAADRDADHCHLWNLKLMLCLTGQRFSRN